MSPGLVDVVRLRLFWVLKLEILVNRVRRPFLATWLAMCLASCTTDLPAPAVAIAKPAPVSGERLAYLVSCVNCHHQTPKEILNAPPLVIVKAYTLPEFTTLLKTGVTRDGRDMYAQGSTMGIVAREQLSHFTEEEMVGSLSGLTGCGENSAGRGQV
jgi:hypothetical protein